MEDMKRTKNHEGFIELLKNTYEKAINEPGLTLDLLMEELREELKEIVK